MCSYWASAPSLSDHAYFGRTYPSDEIATQALPEMIKALGWTNVAVIHISDAYGIAFAEGLRSNSQTCGVNVRATFDFDELNADSIRVAVKNLALMASRDGVNIFVAISTSPTDLSTIFYEAEEQDIVGDGFAWLTTDSVNARVAIEKAPDQARARRLMDGAINVCRHLARTSRESGPLSGVGLHGGGDVGVRLELGQHVGLRAHLRTRDSSMPLPPARPGMHASPTRGPPRPTQTARTTCSTRVRLACSAPSLLSTRPLLTTAWSHSRRRCIPREKTRPALQSSRPSPTSASRVRPAQSRSAPTAIGSPRPSATQSMFGALMAQSSWLRT
jgi:hypothetical protein